MPRKTKRFRHVAKMTTERELSKRPNCDSDTSCGDSDSNSNCVSSSVVDQVVATSSTSTSVNEIHSPDYCPIPLSDLPVLHIVTAHILVVYFLFVSSLHSSVLFIYIITRIGVNIPFR